jgi:flavin-dependent dehydrogenase
VDASAVIIGGGPAGAAAGRLLAAWGHRVLILHRTADRLRGLAESLPPSTLKLLAEIGVRDMVLGAGFYRSTGNTVYWGSRNRQVETFGWPDTCGFQVFRPELDRLLLESAAAGGAEVRGHSTVRAVHLDVEGARVEFEDEHGRQSVSCRYALDCSGRSGVIGHRFRQPGHRMYALVGAWHAPDRWELPDQTHTLVEATKNGWAWSVPVSPSTRHVGVMVEGVSSRAGRLRTLSEAYHTELAGATAHAELVRRASLRRVWACDASTYSAAVYAGPQFLLVGDAGSFIDPLSSFGVKKALASGWIAALVVNTCLRHPDRQSAALEFFTDWERDACAAHGRRSRDFAREAYLRYPSSFWAVRANTHTARLEGEQRADSRSMSDADAGSAPEATDDGKAGPALRPARDPDADAALEAMRDPGASAVPLTTRDPDVHAALIAIKGSPELDLTLADGARFEKHPVIRGREIVLENAFADGAAGSRGLRFWDNVDLVQLADMACRYRQVPDLFDAYCQVNGPVPLPSLLGGLSLLVAKGILRHA